MRWVKKRTQGGQWSPLCLHTMTSCEARLKREIKLFFKDPVEHIIVCAHTHTHCARRA